MESRSVIHGPRFGNPLVAFRSAKGRTFAERKTTINLNHYSARATGDRTSYNRTAAQRIPQESAP